MILPVQYHYQFDEIHFVRRLVNGVVEKQPFTERCLRTYLDRSRKGLLG